MKSIVDWLDAARSLPTVVPDREPTLRGSKAKDLLKSARTWQGDDFEKCLQLVYDTRSQLEF